MITAKQNVAALNVLRSLVKKNLGGCMLYVSNEYYEEWHEDDYKQYLDKYITVGGRQNSLRKWRKHNPGNKTGRNRK